MKEKIIKDEEKSFEQLLIQCLLEYLSWRALVMLALVFFGILMSHSWNFSALSRIVTSFYFWFWLIIVSLADAVIRAAYWYRRFRNPKYIKKQKAYELARAHKEAQKEKNKTAATDQ
jgi:predicted membrane protein